MPYFNPVYVMYPTCVQVSYQVNYIIPVGLYAGLSFLVGVASLALPIETKGKALKVSLCLGLAVQVFCS